MSATLAAARWGFWSSVVILIAGAVLILGIAASALMLPSTLTTGWTGIASYAEAYRATGGTLTALPFLAALASCPAYVVQVLSVHRLGRPSPRLHRRLGLALAVAFALLAGLNYVVQLTVVRLGILSGQTAGLEPLVFQNPGSLMLELDFIGWFCLGLAFLTVLRCLGTGRLNRAIRYVLLANAFLGTLLPLAEFAGNAAFGFVLLATISAVLVIADALFLILFRDLRRSEAGVVPG